MMKQLKATFHDVDVRIVSDDPVTVVLKDVADALGYTTGHLKRAIKDKYTGLHKVDTPGGPQQMTCVTRPGLSQTLATLRPQDEEKRKKVDQFQDWVYEEVLEEIYDTGSYSVDQPKQEEPAEESKQEESYGDPILMLAAATRQIREKQIEMELRVADLEERADQAEKRRIRAEQQMRKLPDADVEAPEMTDRAKLNRIVRAYADATGTRHDRVWNQLYREVYYRLRVDVASRADNRDISKIEVLDQDDLLADAYAVARSIFQPALIDRV